MTAQVETLIFGKIRTFGIWRPKFDLYGYKILNNG